MTVAGAGQNRPVRAIISLISSRSAHFSTGYVAGCGLFADRRMFSFYDRFHNGSKF